MKFVQGHADLLDYEAVVYAEHGLVVVWQVLLHSGTLSAGAPDVAATDQRRNAIRWVDALALQPVVDQMLWAGAPTETGTPRVLQEARNPLWIRHVEGHVASRTTTDESISRKVWTTNDESADERNRLIGR